MFPLPLGTLKINVRNILSALCTNILPRCRGGLLPQMMNKTLYNMLLHIIYLCEVKNNYRFLKIHLNTITVCFRDFENNIVRSL